MSGLRALDVASKLWSHLWWWHLPLLGTGGSRFGGGCWALLEAELFLPFSGSSEASSAHPSFIPGPWGEESVKFSPCKSPPRCVCVCVAPRGAPDNLTWKKPKSFRTSLGVPGVANPLLASCLVLPKLGRQISLLTSDKTHPGGSECVTFLRAGVAWAPSAFWDILF